MSDAPPVPMLDLAAQNAPLAAELKEAFARVLDHGRFILGPEVEAFEQACAEQFGFAQALGVSSGTDALLLALMSLGVGPGDEVVTTPFSFFATAGCIARLGARPVFVDIDPQSFNLDPAGVEAALGPRTRAILPVHLFGRLADMDRLGALARDRGVALIEDAAQALGAGVPGALAGSFGAFACFSFFPSKNLGGFGDGGLLTVADGAQADAARVLRAHGARPKYHHARIGGNFRLDALQAALLGVKLPHLPQWTEQRRVHASAYTDAFAASGLGERLTLPAAVPGHGFNQFVVRTPHRDALQAALAEASIETAIYYPVPLHLQPCFAWLGYREGAFPHAERACREVLALPMFPELSEAQRTRVVDVVVRSLRRGP